MNLTEEWNEKLASRDSKDYAANAADMAQAFWSGRVDDVSMRVLLNSDSSSVRAAVSWAISDLAAPGPLAEYLLERGVTDDDRWVRLNTTALAVKCDALPSAKRLSVLQAARCDSDPTIARYANKNCDLVEQLAANWNRIR